MEYLAAANAQGSFVLPQLAHACDFVCVMLFMNVIPNPVIHTCLFRGFTEFIFVFLIFTVRYVLTWWVQHAALRKEYNRKTTVYRITKKLSHLTKISSKRFWISLLQQKIQFHSLQFQIKNQKKRLPMSDCC